MVRLFTAGAEWNDLIGDYGSDLAAGGPNEATTKRSGSYGYASTNANPDHNYTFTGAVNRWTYARAYIRFSANPTAATTVLSIRTTVSAVESIRALLQTDGTMALTYGSAPGTQVGSASGVLTAGTWYRVELGLRMQSSGNDDLELRIDGSTIASGAVAIGSGAPATIRWGPTSTPPGTGITIYTDDLALNDATGTFQNSWPGEGKVVLLRPTADSQVGSWTGGAGGTSNLYAALDNVPPVGVAAADDTDLTQIKSADDTGDNSTDEYRATTQTYTVGGIAPSDTVTLAQAILWVGEEAGTGAKTGSVAILSNPTQSGVDNFTFADLGAEGVWGTNWAVVYGTAQDASGVTKDTAPVVALRKTDSGSRLASVCALGLYVEYVPSQGFPFRPVSHHLLRR